MAKAKYYYDHETLTYKKIVQKRGRKVRKGISYFVAVLLLMSLGYFLGITFLSRYIESPEVKGLARDLEFAMLNFEVLEKRMDESQKVLNELKDRDDNLYRAYFEATPVSDAQRNSGLGGVNRYKALQGYEVSDLVIYLTKKMDVISKQIYVQSKSLDEVAQLAEDKEELLAAIPAIQPVRNQDLRRMASGYGWRIDPFTKARKKHMGMDFSAATGKPIFAPGNGKVIRADQASSGYGKHIRIDHGFGYVTLYAHLSRYNVKKGQMVKRGDLIGFVGNTGRSKGPHLHYEVIKDGVKINPINFYYGNLSPQEFAAMRKAAQIEGQSLD